MVKRSILLIAVWLLAAGCANEGARIDSINSESETMREGTFEFQYPKDWAISGSQDDTNTQQKKSSYRFAHPKNKKCNVTVEIRSIKDAGSESLKKAISRKIRDVKDTFSRDGYGNLSFQTSAGSLTGKQATRLVITATKDNITRETVVLLLSLRDTVYIVSYQWFDNWDASIKPRLAEIADTFRLVQ